MTWTDVANIVTLASGALLVIALAAKLALRRHDRGTSAIGSPHDR